MFHEFNTVGVYVCVPVCSLRIYIPIEFSLESREKGTVVGWLAGCLAAAAAASHEDALGNEFSENFAGSGTCDTHFFRLTKITGTNYNQSVYCFSRATVDGRERERE